MKRILILTTSNWWFLPVFVIAALLSLSTTGCGGGGGGSSSGGGSNEKRSVATAQATFGSDWLKTNEVVVDWVGDTTGTNYGQAKITAATLVSGTATVSVNPDGSINVINSLSLDTIVINITTIHPTGTGDPQAGQTMTGQITLHITPDNPEANPPTFTVPQGGSVTLVVQALNSKGPGSGDRIVSIRKKSLTLNGKTFSANNRDFVTVPVSKWTVGPTTAGTIAAGENNSAVFTASTSYSGAVTVTATLPTNQAVVATGTVVIPLSATISVNNGKSPVSGEAVPVTYSVTGVATGNVVAWDLDDSNIFYPLPASSGTFNIDSTKLADGDHSVSIAVFDGSFQMNQIFIWSQSFVSDNAFIPPPPDQNGMWVATSETVPIAPSNWQSIPPQDGNTFTPGIPSMVTRLPNGNILVMSGVGTYIMDPSGKLLSWNSSANGGTPAISDDGKYFVGTGGLSDPKVYAYTITNDDEIKLTASILVGGTTSFVCYVASRHRFLVSGDQGIIEINPDGWTTRLISSKYFDLIASNGQVIWVEDSYTSSTELSYDTGQKIKEVPIPSPSEIYFGNYFYREGYNSVSLPIQNSTSTDQYTEQGNLIPNSEFQGYPVGPDLEKGGVIVGYRQNPFTTVFKWQPFQ